MHLPQNVIDARLFRAFVVREVGRLETGVRVGVAALRRGGLAAEEGSHAAHESGLAAAGVRGQADDDGAVRLRRGDDVATGSAGLGGSRELRLGAEGLAGREGLSARGGHGHGSGHRCCVGDSVERVTGRRDEEWADRGVSGRSCFSRIGSVFDKNRREGKDARTMDLTTGKNHTFLPNAVVEFYERTPNARGTTLHF